MQQAVSVKVSANSKPLSCLLKLLNSLKKNGLRCSETSLKPFQNIESIQILARRENKRFDFQTNF
jgi:hypothetical protein